MSDKLCDPSASENLLGNTQKVRINMDALVGLRGVCCVWIMVFHCVLFSKLQWDIEGSSIMPLFLMLSGFTLAVVYAKEKPTPFDQVQGGDVENNYAFDSNADGNEDLFTFERCKFYQNRFARVGPLYYLTMLVAIPYNIAGFGVCDPKVVFGTITAVNVVPVSTLFSFYLGAPYDGPAWTVATLAVFWCFFPDILLAAKKMTSEQLVRWICLCYYLQVVLLFVSLLVLLPLTNIWIAFGTATMNPITRFPLFLMGIYAGILCLRHPVNGTNTGDSNMFAELPWPEGLLTFFPFGCGAARHGSKQTTNWVDKTFFSSMSLLGITAIYSIMDSGVFPLYGSITLQAFVPFAQLTVVVGLTRDCSDGNRIYRILTTPTMNYLGQISMTVYLVHFLFYSYLLWIIYGHGLTYCNSLADDADCDAWGDAKLLPLWGIPVVIAATMIVSPLLYWGFEEPGRRMLQASK